MVLKNKDEIVGHEMPIDVSGAVRVSVNAAAVLKSLYGGHVTHTFRQAFVI